MKKLLIANWKMQLSYQDSLALAKSFRKKIKKSTNELVICPDYLSLPAVAAVLKGSQWQLGAQDSAGAATGAYTGEVSPANLKKLGAAYAIIGHSERREHLHENGAVISAKIKAALAQRLVPILCVGERLIEKENGEAKKYLSEQLRLSLKGVKIKKSSDLVIAYEPLWAIGTGHAIIPLEAGLINNFIKTQAAKILGKTVRVLYGGSVSAANAGLFLAEKDVDGLLVGGASLKTEEFKRICS
jgi:triosephosphate isomerase